MKKNEDNINGESNITDSLKNNNLLNNDSGVSDNENK